MPGEVGGMVGGVNRRRYGRHWMGELRPRTPVAALPRRTGLLIIGVRPHACAAVMAGEGAAVMLISRGSFTRRISEAKPLLDIRLHGRCKAHKKALRG